MATRKDSNNQNLDDRLTRTGDLSRETDRLNENEDAGTQAVSDVDEEGDEDYDDEEELDEEDFEGEEEEYEDENEDVDDDTTV
jgi:hypothetical protein